MPLNVDSKEVIERTAGKWIVEASDLQGYVKRDVDHLTSFLSRQTDGPVRLAYARESTERDRHFIIAGTTNPEQFLGKDKTGNRRFWPVPVKRFDTLALRAVRDQLWAGGNRGGDESESIRLDPSL